MINVHKGGARQAEFALRSQVHDSLPQARGRRAHYVCLVQDDAVELNIEDERPLALLFELGDLLVPTILAVVVVDVHPLPVIAGKRVVARHKDVDPVLLNEQQLGVALRAVVRVDAQVRVTDAPVHV